MTTTGKPQDADRLIRLADGVCHYHFDGPPDGRRILLIHGGTVAAWEFDRLAPFLHRAGWRTLRPDLYGHGYSDRPRTRYRPELFVRQVLGLLDALGITQPLPVLGHSLGAAVAARLLVRAPDRFTCAVLGAPLVDYLAAMPATRMLRWPVAGELLMPALAIPLLVRRRARNYRAIEGGRFIARFNSQLALPGYGRALLSMFRDGALGDQAEAYRALGGGHHPIAVMRGEHDAIVSMQQVATVLDSVPRAVFHDIRHAGHAFMLTDPSRVAPSIIDFVTRHAAQQAAAETGTPHSVAAA